MSPLQTLARFRESLIAAITDCIQQRRLTPALILIYAGIDIFASLEAAKATRSSFISWSGQYIVRCSGLQCTAIDLYSARCGVLHAMSAESRMTRDGDARQVIYAWGNATAQELQSRADSQGRNACAIHIDDLFSAFTLGIDVYIAEVEKDAARMSKVLETLQNVFTDVAIR